MIERALLAVLVFCVGYVAGWWRREDPFVRRCYGYHPAREPWDIYS